MRIPVEYKSMHIHTVFEMKFVVEILTLPTLRHRYRNEIAY